MIARAGIARAALALGLVACLPASAQPEAPSRLPPPPSVEAIEEGPRRRVEALYAEAEAVAKSGAPASELAAAVGALGQLYLAYEIFDAAEASFRACLASSPNDPRWSYYLGVALKTRGELEEALESFLRVREQSPGEVANLIRLGELSLELDRPESAREAFAAAQAADPAAAAAARHGLGKVAIRLGEHRAAVEHLEAALELQPEATVIHYQLGQAYRKLGDLDRAREHLRQRGDAEVAFPDPLGDEVAWLVLGAAFDALQQQASVEEGFSERDFLGFAQSQFGEVEGAADQLREALRIRAEEVRALDPDSREARRDRLVRARVHYAVGALLVNRRADHEAATHFRAALELEPSLLDCRVKLGNVLARAGDLEGAVAEYTRVLERDAENTDALLKRGAAWMGLDRPGEAAADLERLRALAPANGEAVLRLAVLRADAGDAERARQLYREALRLELDPAERLAAHTRLGSLERQLGSPDAALAEYRAALELQPDLVDVRFRLATTLGGLGRYDEAAVAYRELIGLDPRHEPARLGEATALALAGREAAARVRLEEGVAAMPESLAITHALARLLATATDRAVRDGARALEQAQRVVQTLASLEHAETLAMALAEAGRPADAVQVQERLVAEAESRGDASVLARLRSHLGLYRAGLACCEPPAERD